VETEQPENQRKENAYIKMYKAKKDNAKVSSGKDGMLRSSLSDENEHITNIDLTPDQKLQYEYYLSQFPAMAKV
jgi:hypothetical protein